MKKYDLSYVKNLPEVGSIIQNRANSLISNYDFALKLLKNAESSIKEFEKSITGNDIDHQWTKEEIKEAKNSVK